MVYDPKTSIPQVNLVCGYINPKKAAEVRAWLIKQFSKYHADNVADVVRALIWAKYQEDKPDEITQ